ncbi:uncharacterized protein N7446_000705 [Penicillium canescens]|uniref:DUF6546 domain-containing protein n=1 Tax=Penicillium canescens TaxID=5083 RepID=A0AAD6N590_PENCN|nr:uncharacterized protein N7446_000705 [Penicillium canescens]KAJ6030235.1 hypothetical protein N7460_010501 [Penicillium canescens]KAJ6060610.1 hypothetical protein N7444_002464 [Penicillium canescens]KAJ6077769.1 hypothetical protein N7446_000705 [Penicillium canescens]
MTRRVMTILALIYRQRGLVTYRVLLKKANTGVFDIDISRGLPTTIYLSAGRAALGMPKLNCMALWTMGSGVVHEFDYEMVEGAAKVI